MSEVLQSGHPDADQLTAFMEHALPEDARQQTLAHLAVCPDCRMVVMLASEPVEVAPVVVAARWWMAPAWQWGLAGVVVAGLVLVTVHRPSAPVVKAPGERAAVNAPAVRAPVLPPALPMQKAIIPKGIARPLPMPAAPAVPEARAGVGAALAPALQPPAIPVPQPAEAAAPEPAPVVAANADLQTRDSGSAFAASSVDQGMVEAKTPVSRPLPSGLAGVSGASSAGTMVELDAGNHLFVTRDGGAHWVAVAAQWSGKAVRVGLVGADSGRGIGAVDSLMLRAPQSSVTGLVRDPTGASIPGVTVTLSDPVTKAVVRTVKTDKDGRYAMASPAGDYVIEAQMAGFMQSDVVIAVPAGTQFNQNVTMQVGSVSETVEVAASNADLATTNAEAQKMLRESKKAPMRASVLAAPKVEPVFELVTENGEHWVSVDGSLWRRK